MEGRGSEMARGPVWARLEPPSGLSGASRADEKTRVHEARWGSRWALAAVRPVHATWPALRGRSSGLSQPRPPF